MRRMLAMLLALLALCCPAAAQEMRYGQAWGRDSGDGRAALYAAPDGRVLGELEGGQAVLVSGAEAYGWVNASLGGIGGYMRSTDVEFGGAPKAGESELLETHELAIAPGLDVTLEAWGGALRFDRHDQGYLCEIRVFQNGAMIDRLAYLCETVPQDAPHLSFDDVNMDGYQDIIALRTMGASDAYAVWYLYDAQTGTFVRNLALGRFSAWRYKLLPESDMIINIVHESAASGYYETYQWQDGALAFIEGGAWPRGDVQEESEEPPPTGATQRYTYGGSEDDALGEMAVSRDGRIVLTGYTNSHDGTLQSRTKKGRTGWALCLNADCDVLWSFCSRLGVHDDMSSPVFHEDGSVTLLLYAEMDGGQEIELIRLNQDGEVTKRRTLLKTDGKDYITVIGAAQRGYVLMRDKGADLKGLEYLRFSFDGEQDMRFDDRLEAINEAADMTLQIAEGKITNAVRIPGGYAATGYSASQEGAYENMQWMLWILDEAENVVKTKPLGLDSATGADMPIAALPDGSVCILGLAGDGRGGRDGCLLRVMP